MPGKRNGLPARFFASSPFAGAGADTSARQRGIFLGRSDLARKCNNVAKYTMFRHCTDEFHLQIYDIALSAQCADVVSPPGKQPGGYYPLNYCVIAPGDHFILIRYAAHHPYTVCATEFPLGNLMAYARRNFCLVIPNKKAVPKSRFGTANRLTNGVWAVFLQGSRPDGGRCGYRGSLTRAVRREPGCRRRLRWCSPASGRPSRPADRRHCRR